MFQKQMHRERKIETIDALWDIYQAQRTLSQILTDQKVETIRDLKKYIIPTKNKSRENINVDKICYGI